MAKTMQDILKDNLPSGLKNNDLVTAYLEAFGEILEEIRQDINYKAFETDYAKAKPETLSQLAANFGLDLSPKLKPDLIRRMVRDAPEVFTRLGTRPTLEWALKSLGYRNFDIDEVWAPNPDLLRIGYFRQIGDVDDPIRYDIKRSSYTDFVVGNEYVDAGGTYFSGFTYGDFDKENPITGIPIYGERYQDFFGQSFNDMVSKTPYILVRLYETPVYDDVVATEDPVTGDPIVLTTGEKQQIVINAIRSIVQLLQRTATTKIILVTDLLIFDINIARPREVLEFVYRNYPVNFSDNISIIQEDYVNDGKVDAGFLSFNLSTVGSGRVIGDNAPIMATGEYISSGKIGVVTVADNNILDAVRAVNATYPVINPSNGQEKVIYLDYGANVSFTAPAGVDIRVEKMKNYWTSGSRTLVNTVSGGTTFNNTSTDSHVYILTFLSSYTGQVNISVTY